LFWQVTVLDADRQKHKIRLQGIDTPEKAQPFGQRSKENLSRLVFNKEVRVEWKKRDRHKRIVGKVWVQPESCPSCPMTLDTEHATKCLKRQPHFIFFDCTRQKTLDPDRHTSVQCNGLNEVLISQATMNGLLAL